MPIGKGITVKTAFSILPALLLTLLTGVVLSCGRDVDGRIRRHDLFVLSPGTLAGELDWFYRDGFRIAANVDIYTRDGLVYLSGGEAGKVLVLNSYGDLLTLIYDPERNPEPARPDDDEGGRSIRSWPLRNTGAIVAGSSHILVEDLVTADRRILDDDIGALCDRVILRFDRDGNYVDYLGREGVGGLPFPFIESLDVREDGGIVVTGRTVDGWLSWWFDADGHPTATVKIDLDKLPTLGDSDRSSVYMVKPDPRRWFLYLRIDHYPPEGSEETLQARLYPFDLTTRRYGTALSLPLDAGSGGNDPPIPPDYIGTSVDGTHFLLAPERTDTYRLIVMDSDGRIVHRRRLMVDDNADVYRLFRLQPDGLLAGIFLGGDEATVSWWRSDRLTGNEKD